MRYSTALFLLTGMLRQVAAELTITSEATHNGQAIDPANVKLQPIEPVNLPLNLTTKQPPTPPPRPGSKRRVRRSASSSGNWCGAVAQTTTSNPFTKVYAAFNVPSLTGRAGVSSYPQYAGEWVGIDGYTNGVVLQAGVAETITSGGQQSLYAWLQWYPGGAFQVPSVPVSSGDWMEITITASSATSGVVTIINYTQNYTYSGTLNNSNTNARLSRTSAEWILEDPSSGGNLQPFAAFEDVWFENLFATTSNNANVNLASATMISISGKCTASKYSDTDFYAYST